MMTFLKKTIFVGITEYFFHAYYRIHHGFWFCIFRVALSVYSKICSFVLAVVEDLSKQ